MKRLIPFICLLLTALPLGAKKQASGPTRLKKQAQTEEIFDTIRPAEGRIRCAGYDKPNRATRETFFLTNALEDSTDIDAVCLTFDYFDMKGRLLHSATHTIRVNLGAGRTLNVSVSSWDRNNAFHYYLSPAPQRRASTPYKVTSRIDYALRRVGRH